MGKEAESQEDYAITEGFWAAVKSGNNLAIEVLLKFGPDVFYSHDSLETEYSGVFSDIGSQEQCRLRISERDSANGERGGYSDGTLEEFGGSVACPQS